MNEKLLNITEVARYLGVSEEAVEELVRKGELPAYKIGEDLLRFRKEQVEARKQYVPMAQNKRPGMNHTITPNQESAPYTFWERFADFLYYNDFYILSLIILVLTIVLVFGF